MRNEVDESRYKTSQPTEKEINRVIAEFMGVTLVDSYNRYREVPEQMFVNGNTSVYTRSLDALVPVWEKLNCLPVFDKLGSVRSCELVEGWSGGRHFENAVSESIYLAAAEATCIAIKELRDSREG